MIRFIDVHQLPVDANQTRESFDHVFVGPAVDDRGRRSSAIASASAQETVLVNYEPATFRLHLGPATFRASDLAGIRHAHSGGRVLLDATSLDPIEMLILSRAFLSDSADRRQMGFIYAEPERYLPLEDSGGLDQQYHFTDTFRGFHPVPGFADELREDEMGRLVACLGFEPARLDRILQEDDGTFIRHVTLIFGVPPYQTSWELHALLPHARIISQRICELTYAGANNPKATYECLKESFRAAGSGERLILAPLGSKPSSIGVALFACCRNKIRLKYDFPVRIEGRTEGVGAIYLYLVSRDSP